MPIFNPWRNLLYTIKILQTSQPQNNIINMLIKLHLSIESWYREQINRVISIIIGRRVRLAFKTFMWIYESY